MEKVIKKLGQNNRDGIASFLMEDERRSSEVRITEAVLLAEIRRRYPDSWKIYRDTMNPHDFLSFRERMEIEGPNRILLRSDERAPKNTGSITLEDLKDYSKKILESHPRVKRGDLVVIEKYIEFGADYMTIWDGEKLIPVVSSDPDTPVTVPYNIRAITEFPPYYYLGYNRLYSYNRDDPEKDEYGTNSRPSYGLYEGDDGLWSTSSRGLHPIYSEHNLDISNDLIILDLDLLRDRLLHGASMKILAMDNGELLLVKWTVFTFNGVEYRILTRYPRKIIRVNSVGPCECSPMDILKDGRIYLHDLSCKVAQNLLQDTWNEIEARAEEYMNIYRESLIGDEVLCTHLSDCEEVIGKHQAIYKNIFFGHWTYSRDIYMWPKNPWEIEAGIHIPGESDEEQEDERGESDEEQDKERGESDEEQDEQDEQEDERGESDDEQEDEQGESDDERGEIDEEA